MSNLLTIDKPTKIKYINKITPDFYQRSDVLKISQELIGKVIFSNFANKLTAGIIVETEAYCAPEDKASHAYGNRRTKRTETMFMAGGVAYVYLCYGIHHLFNVVTGPKDMPHAVLIRAIEPIIGIEHMLQRRALHKIEPRLTAGPGALTQALGISTIQNGFDLSSEQLYIADCAIDVRAKSIYASPRIGIAYAAEYAHKPWRFCLKDNLWLSKK